MIGSSENSFGGLDNESNLQRKAIYFILLDIFIIYIVFKID